MKPLLPIFILCGLFLSGVSHAQKESHLALWQQYQNDSLKLVWIPVTTETWIQNNHAGYKVERAVVLKNKIQSFEVVVARVKPRALADLQGSPEEIGVVNMALSAGNEAIENDPTGKKEADFQSLKHLTAIISAYKSYAMAQQMGLGWVDLSALKNTEYVYRVTGLGATKDTAYVKASTHAPSAIAQPPVLQMKSMEKQVMLTWPAKFFMREFMMYHVERSSDGKTFRRLTTAPIMYSDIKMEHLFHKDSLGENYKPYLYRLSGLNPFGQWVSSDLPVIGMGKDMTPPDQPYITQAKHIAGSLVSISWTQKDTPDLKGFRVTRSNSINQNFITITEKLLDKTTFSFTDQHADVRGTNHYTVVAIDTAGNEASSLPAFVVMEDLIPPQPPKNLRAVTDTLGRVSISWDKSPDDDVKGYYVYFANAPDHEFSQITKTLLTETSFRDTITLKSLTKRLYYKVVAVDDHFNHSTFSEHFALKRPDIIRPIAPLIEKVETRAGSVILTWPPSPSNDAALYQVLRKTGNTDFTPISEIKAGTGSRYTFEDSGIESGAKYTYSILVVDESGLHSDPSPPKVISVSPPQKTVAAPVLTSIYDKEKKVNAVTWAFREKEDFRIAIYRIESKSGYKLIGFCDSKTSTFADPVAEKNKYRYCARAILADGTQGAWSNEVTTH